MTETIDTQEHPRLYVGTYAKYNNGSIKGAWLDLTEYSDKEAFLTACAELHKDEHDPEFMFQDFENFPEAFYNESFIGDKLFEYIALDEDDRLTVKEYLNAVGVYNLDELDFEQAIDSFETELTTFNREQEYGEYLVDSGVFEVDQNSALANYIDYEKLGREYLMDCSVSDNGYVFRNY